MITIPEPPFANTEDAGFAPPPPLPVKSQLELSVPVTNPPTFSRPIIKNDVKMNSRSRTVTTDISRNRSSSLTKISNNQEKLSIVKSPTIHKSRPRYISNYDVS